MEKENITISIVGTGNVGYHLSRKFKSQGVTISHIMGTNSSQALKLSEELNAKIVNSIEDLPEDQLVLLCIPDDEIKDFIQELSAKIPVAYTSGSVDLKTLPKRENIGVFYPLQTFTRSKDIDINQVPFFIEGTSPKHAERLYELASVISERVQYADSEERKKIHLTAVWVNNFTNHMIHIAKEYAQNNDLNFDNFKPLLAETISKIDKLSPYEAQTGPARRGDINTIKEHLNQLSGMDKELYALISESIQNTYQIK